MYPLLRDKNVSKVFPIVAWRNRHMCTSPSMETMCQYVSVSSIADSSKSGCSLYPIYNTSSTLSAVDSGYEDQSFCNGNSDSSFSAKNTVQIQEHRGQHAGQVRPHHMLQTEEEVLDTLEDDPLRVLEKLHVR
ncbi:hypothetical protein NQ317_008591 [Molorchus minor]|uniref:Uncharacterized protein n=1 Tax=Molorchus minor TaxID=1323400 RepID=A0ABQ9JKW7_9CUCU|nr:hypothetical protein NQ317_008591 [Molorchus minor]